MHHNHGRILKAREMMNMQKVCIVGASGKLGQYMVQHALDRGYEVVGVCREKSVGKPSPTFKTQGKVDNWFGRLFRPVDIDDQGWGGERLGVLKALISSTERLAGPKNGTVFQSKNRG
jgi:nucleoside-diphosphate-sugar epimerase